MREVDIFDLGDLKDLPKNLRKNVKIIRAKEDTRMLLGLFDIKQTLSIDEILVALYRLHKLVRTRVWVSSTLYNLSQKGLLERITGNKGIYKRT